MRYILQEFEYLYKSKFYICTHTHIHINVKDLSIDISVDRYTKHSFQSIFIMKWVIVVIKYSHWVIKMYAMHFKLFIDTIFNDSVLIFSS